MVVALACTAFSPDDCPAVRPSGGSGDLESQRPSSEDGLSPFGLADVCFGSGEDISTVSEQCPLFPRKRTPADAIRMSVLCQKRTSFAARITVGGLDYLRIS